MRQLRFSLLSLLLLLPAAVCAAADADEQQARLEELRSRIEGLRAQMQSKSGEKTELSRLLQDAEQHIGRLARRLRDLDAQLSRQRERLEQLRRERLTRSQALDGHRGALADQVRALAQTESEILDQERRLLQLHDEQTRELAALRQSQEQRRGVVGRLARELTDQGLKLDRLKADERDLKTLISGLKEALADIPLGDPQQQKFIGLRGRLPWPANGRIVSRYGAPRLGGLVWDGVMISAPEGREVRAVHHGRVAFADWLRGFGLLLIVDHGDGYMTLYGHNQSLFKEAGDWVEVNEPVALVGSSGGRERAGVYFGIRFQGRAVDPAKWCRRPVGSRVG